jgi:hypothetical protein
MEALKTAYSPPPVSPDVAGLLKAVSISKERAALENSKRVIEDQLDNLLMRRIEAGSGQEQELKKTGKVSLILENQETSATRSTKHSFHRKVLLIRS